MSGLYFIIGIGLVVLLYVAKELGVYQERHNTHKAQQNAREKINETVKSVEGDIPFLTRDELVARLRKRIGS